MAPATVIADEPSLQAAVMALRCGELVAFPTETVYGLGADTRSPAAIESIYAIKGRPTNNPVIAHVADAAMARSLVRQWDERAEALARGLWPGPLTLVLPRSDDIPAACTAGLDTIAVRCPAHPIAQFLIRRFGGAISAPSANRSGRVSPTTAAHVASEFADVDRLTILDGGPCLLGIESTVLDLSGPLARILRPGSVTPERISEFIGAIDVPTVDRQTIAPGTSASHYAPTTATRLIDAATVASSLRERTERGGTAAIVVIGASIEPGTVAPPHHLIEMPANADAYAARLYAALREADALGAAEILVVIPPTASGVWLAVHDRLRRATR